MCSYNEEYVKNVDAKMEESLNARYVLTVELNGGNGSSCAVIMKNPSKANKEKSDRSVNNVIKVAYKKKFSKVYILNLYSYYSPDVNNIKDLILENDSTHMNANDECIKDVIGKVDKVIIAWGTVQGSKKLINKYNERVSTVYQIIKDKELLVFDEDFTNSKFPKHPQTLAMNSTSDLTLKEWTYKEAD